MTSYAHKGLKELRRRAYVVAYRKGYRQEASEFAQDYIVKLLEGKAQHQTIDQALVDWLRKTCGKSPEQRQFRVGISAGRYDARLVLEALESDDGTPLEILLSRERVDQAATAARSFVARAMAILTEQYGFTSGELAIVFGVEETCVEETLKRNNAVIQGIAGKLEK